MPKKQIEQGKITDLVQDSYNLNKGTERGQYVLKKSVESVGLGRSILVDKHNRIIAGNKTTEAAFEAGLEDVVFVHTTGNQLVAVVRDDLDLEQDPKAREMAIADNRASEVGYDLDVERLLAIAQQGEVDVTAYYKPEELAFYQKMLEQANEQEGKQGDGEKGGSGKEPVEPIESRFEPGSIWQVGSQMIICGDCRDPETWEKLFWHQSKSIALCFTSPPYADQRKYDEASGFKPISPDHYVAWFEAVQANVRNYLAEDGTFCVNIKENVEDGQRLLYVKDLTLAFVRQWEWFFKEEFACVHSGTPARVWHNFKNGWEPVLQFSLGKDIKIRPHAVAELSSSVPLGGGGNVSTLQGTGSTFEGVEVGEGLAFPTNVWKFYRNREANGHDAAFAPEFPEQWIKAFTDTGDLVVDPFTGSGSTLVAASRNGRLGAGVELSPINCEIALSRLERECGAIAQKVS